MKTQLVEKKAAELNLNTAHITQGMNNYPVNTDDEIGVIGFDNFAEAEALKNEFEQQGLDAEICLLKRRDGWHFWKNMGRKYKPLTVQDYINDLGDDYFIYCPENDFDILKQKIQDVTDVESIIELVENYTKAKNEYDSLEEDEVLIMCQNIPYEQCKKEMMSYYEDVWTWSIAVVVNTEEEVNGR